MGRIRNAKRRWQWQPREVLRPQVFGNVIPEVFLHRCRASAVPSGGRSRTTEIGLRALNGPRALLVVAERDGLAHVHSVKRCHALLGYVRRYRGEPSR